MASMMSCGVRFDAPDFSMFIPVLSVDLRCSPFVRSSFTILCSKLNTFSLAGSTVTSIQCTSDAPNVSTRVKFERRRPPPLGRSGLSIRK